MSDSRMILTGFSGTGKTEVGQEVARLLGWRFVDTDEEIVARTGKPIADIFAQEGEPRFRDLEREAVREACQLSRVVISTGGGALLDPESRALMLASGLVVCLEAQPDTIYRRLSQGGGNGGQEAVRPLLAGPDPQERIRILKSERQWAYALAHWTVHTDSLTTQQVAQEVLRAWRMPVRGAAAEHDPELAAVVYTSAGACPVYVGWDILESQLGRRLRDSGVAPVVYIISEEQVFGHHGGAVQRSLQQAEIPAHTFVFPPGEQSKTLQTAEHIYHWLAERRAERGHAILALGGGVTGDLAGFVAATYLRGMPLIQVPTSLTAMVDASVGGKVAVDLPQGKNLVGAFRQPALVLADVKTLTTMPQRELREGWAEAVKHGLILARELFETFEQKSKELLALEQGVTTDVIRRSVAIKARIVSEDERETTGRRTLLNYGHTIGHGLEAASGYRRYLHGEAVSIGMMGAARIGHRLGVTPHAVIQRQQALLESLGLPTRFQDVDVAAVLKALALDKKTTQGSIRWVVLEEIGRATTRQDVPEKLVREVLESLRSS